MTLSLPLPTRVGAEIGVNWFDQGFIDRTIYNICQPSNTIQNENLYRKFISKIHTENSMAENHLDLFPSISRKK